MPIAAYYATIWLHVKPSDLECGSGISTFRARPAGQPKSVKIGRPVGQRVDQRLRLFIRFILKNACG
jgi:hypothetical protein